MLHSLKKQLFVFLCVIATSTVISTEHATVSAYAVHIPTGKVLVDRNSDKSLMPSSCLKVVTTAAALNILGPEAQFETKLEYDGTLDKFGTLHGNLYIHGGGDPCLGSDRIASSLSWQKQIDAWVAAIQEKGIKKIEGSVIGDASLWEKALAVPSWQWEDIGNYYGAGACALSFHENYYTLFFRPGAFKGEKATILKTDPAISTIIIQNEVTTGSAGSGDNAWIYGSEYSPVQYVRGTIPAGVGEFAIKGTIPDPSAFCADLLSHALQEKGITVDQRNLTPKTKRDPFHTTLSPMVGKIVHWTNQKSINLYAEHLLKKMGELVQGEGSTVAGAQVVTNYWRNEGIDLDGFNMADGSGLSRKNLVTTKQLVSILLKMKQSKLFPAFLKSLPKQNDLIRAKDGSMSLAKSYTGYAGDIAFAIIINQCADPKAITKKMDTFFADLKQISEQSKKQK